MLRLALVIVIITIISLCFIVIIGDKNEETTSVSGSLEKIEPEVEEKDFEDLLIQILEVKEDSEPVVVLSKDEATAQSVGYSWATPLSLKVSEKQEGDEK